MYMHVYIYIPIYSHEFHCHVYIDDSPIYISILGFSPNSQPILPMFYSTDPLGCLTKIANNILKIQFILLPKHVFPSILLTSVNGNKTRWTSHTQWQPQIYPVLPITLFHLLMRLLLYFYCPSSTHSSYCSQSSLFLMPFWVCGLYA